MRGKATAGKAKRRQNIIFSFALNIYCILAVYIFHIHGIYFVAYVLFFTYRLSVAATSMNDRSSRSHCIFTVYIGLLARIAYSRYICIVKWEMVF